MEFVREIREDKYVIENTEGEDYLLTRDEILHRLKLGCTIVGASADGKICAYPSIDSFISQYKMRAKLTGSAYFDLELSETEGFIGTLAEEFKDSITEIRVPDFITELGASAFEGCSKLVSVYMHDNVTKIGESAFCDCTALENINVPKNLETIEESAFWTCTSLRTFQLDETYTKLNEIGEFAFGYSGLTGLVIPNYISIICKSAFVRCDDLISVSLNGGIGEIGKEAFSNCKNLAKFAVSGTTYTIGCEAFKGCTSLKTISFDGVISIGKMAFTSCSKLESISIQGHFQELPEGVFSECFALRDVVLSSEHTLIIESSAFFRCISLEKFPLVSSGVKQIKRRAFACCVGLTSLVLPQCLERIEEEAFRGCIGIVDIFFSQDIEYIGEYAFTHCVGISFLNLPRNLKFIANGAFKGCLGLTDLDELSGLQMLKKIGKEAFACCRNLLSVKLPNIDGLELEDGIFRDCPALMTAHLDGVVTIPKDCFDGCGSLLAVGLSACTKQIGIHAFRNCSSLKEIDLNRVNKLGTGCFQGCTSLETLVIPPSVHKFMSDFLGESQHKLKFLYIAETTNFVNRDKRVVADHIVRYKTLNKLSARLKYVCDDRDGEYVFVDSAVGVACTLSDFELMSLSKDTYIEGVCNNKVIPYPSVDAFLARHEMREKLTASDYFTYYVDESFGIAVKPTDKARDLERINIPNFVNYIPEYVFSNYKHLRHVTLPKNLRRLDSGAFLGCTCLESVDIPPSLDTIGVSAFEGCSSLQSVTLPMGLKAISACVFKECALTSIQIPSSVSVIGARAFSMNKQLSSVTIDDSKKDSSKLQFIGDSAFSYCSSLTKIEIPNSVTYIGSYAFAYSGLEYVRLPQKWSVYYTYYLGTYVFRSSKIRKLALASDEIDYKVPDGLCHDCKLLQSVEFNIQSRGTLTIGDKAFAKCPSLTSIKGKPEHLIAKPEQFEGSSITVRTRQGRSYFVRKGDAR